MNKNRFESFPSWLGPNYQILEYLGDSLINMYLASNGFNPRKLGSNEHLYDLAKSISLEKYICVD